MALTPDQTKAASIISGHTKVLAGAGSGKSTMLVERIINLLNAGIPPSSILVVMFGKEAATSFQTKLKKRLASTGHATPMVSTFHSLATKLLANKLTAINELPRAKLETRDWHFKQLCIKTLESYLPDRKQIFGALFDFMSFIDLTKSHLEGPRYTMTAYDIPSERTFFVDAFARFERLRKKENIRFFADLIYDPVKLLVDKPSLIQEVNNLFDHIMVDEFQDINPIQFFMVNSLAGSRAHVMVVGDDDQCIYGWRGANPYYMIRGFEETFKGAQTIELRQSFRYGHQIASAAYSLISNNKKRNPKLAVSAGSAPKTILSIDKEMPGQRSVNKHIRTWMQTSGSRYHDVVVLIRAFSHSVAVEIGLLEDGIPYVLEGADPLFMAPDIGAVMAGLHLLNGSFSRMNQAEKANLALKFISFPSLRLDADATRSLIERIRQDPDGSPVYLDDAIFDERDQNKKTGLRERSLAWRNLLDAGKGKSPQACIKEIMEILRIKNEIEFTSKTDEEKEAKRERFEAFILYAEHCQMALHEFVDHIQALAGKASSKAAHDALDERGHVLITSIHRSKGLEWPLVIIPKLIEGKFPLIKNGFISQDALEDERRLLYVGITRAQRQCILIAPPDGRFDYCSQRGLDSPQEPIEPGEGAASRFLYELNPFLCQRADVIVRGDTACLKAVKSPDKMIKYVKTYVDVSRSESSLARPVEG